MLSMLFNYLMLIGKTCVKTTHPSLPRIIELCATQVWGHRSIIPTTLEAQAGGLVVQSLSKLQNEFKASLGRLVRLSPN